MMDYILVVTVLGGPPLLERMSAWECVRNELDWKRAQWSGKVTWARHVEAGQREWRKVQDVTCKPIGPAS